MSVTSAPILYAQSARASPILPEEEFVIYLTGSIFSLVPPAVIKTFFPLRVCPACKISTVFSKISSGSLILPTPFVPQARNPVSGSII